MFIVMGIKDPQARWGQTGSKKEPEKNPSSGDSKRKHDQENCKMCGMMRQGKESDAGDTV